MAIPPRRPLATARRAAVAAAVGLAALGAPARASGPPPGAPSPARTFVAGDVLPAPPRAATRADAAASASAARHPARDGAGDVARPAAVRAAARAEAPRDRRPAGRAQAGDAVIAPNVMAFTQAQTGWTPASPAVAAGGGFVVAAVNSHFGTWTADGEPAPGGAPVALADFYAPLLSTVPPEFALDVGQPQLLRDPATGRWVLAVIAWPKDADRHWPVVLLSTSDTPDPTASWCSHFVPVGLDEDGTNNAVLDRIQLGLTRGGLVLLSNLTAHQGEHEFRFRTVRIHVAPTAQLFGSACRAVDVPWVDLIDDSTRTTFDQAVLAPSASIGDAVYAVGGHSAGGVEVRLWPITVGADGALAEPVAFTLQVPAYDVPPDAAQPGTSIALYTGGAGIQSAAQRGDDLWAVQSVDHGGRAGIAWYRFDLADLGGSETGRFGIGDTAHAFYPAIVPADACDNAMVVYGTSGPDAPAGVGLTDIRGDQAYDVAVGEGCVANRGDGASAWGAQIGLTVDAASGRVWGHAPFAVGIAGDCAANGWATALFGVDWDICAGVGPAPTPVPEGERGIGFALASKRVMRGVYDGGGLVARRGAMSGAALTGIQVQNIDGQRTSQPSLNFAEQRLPYEAPGRVLFSRTVDMRPIPPGASLNAYVPALDLIDAMFRVTITTPRDGGDLSAILRTDWDSGGAAIVSNLSFTERTVLPVVSRRAAGHSSVIALSNAEAEPVVATVRFFRHDAAAEVARLAVDLEGTEALTFDLADDVPALRALGDGFAGAAVVDAPGGRVGAQVYAYVESSDLAVGGYEGLPAGDASGRLFVPLFRSQQSGPGAIRLNTAVAVANAGPSETAVTLTYHPTTNASASADCRARGAVRHGPVRIPPQSSHVFSQGPGGGHGLPANCFGSAVVDAAPGGRVVATVVDIQNDAETLSMINASPVEQAGRKVALPLFRSRHLVAAFTTGIQVMNTTAAAANVHIDFSRSEGVETFPIPGCRGQCDAVLGPFEGYTWWPPAVAAIPNGTYGAAVITSDAPIVVLVNDYPLNGDSDMATYAGIPVLTEP